MTLEPNIGLYGDSARLSAATDFLELAALCSHNDRSPLLSNFVEYLDDPGIDLSKMQGKLGERDRTFGKEEVRDQIVNNVIKMRSDVLGNGLYPFELKDDNSRLVYDSSVDPFDSAYVEVLCTSLCHSYKSFGGDAEGHFEKVVKEAVTDFFDRGNSEQFSPNGRGIEPFRKEVKRVGTMIGLGGEIDPSITSSGANDGGLDIVTWWGVDDGRAGQVVFLGQATCGKTGTWKAKIHDFGLGIWKQNFNLNVTPFGFLAVPYHADTDYLRKITFKFEKRFVLDRLRIVWMLREATGDGGGFLEELRSKGVVDV